MSNEVEHKMEKASFYVSKHVKEKLQKYAKEKSLPISRLIGIAVDYELSKDNPFEFDINIPTEEYIEHAYIDEAGRILDYIKNHEGLGIDLLLLVREEMGISDKKIFMLAFRELINVEMIEGRKPFKSFIKYADDYKLWYVHTKHRPPKVKSLERKAKKLYK